MLFLHIIRVRIHDIGGFKPIFGVKIESIGYYFCMLSGSDPIL